MKKDEIRDWCIKGEIDLWISDWTVHRSKREVKRDLRYRKILES